MAFAFRFCLQHRDAKRFTASYQNDDEEYLLKYEERTYSTADRAVRAGQNELGESMEINGTKIYMVSNVRSCLRLTNHLTYYSLYGPVSEKEMLSILEELGGNMKIRKLFGY